MSEGGEQKTKRLIIYKTHTISYDHLFRKEEKKTKTLIIYKKHTISYDHLCLKEENKTKKTNHIQDTHNQLCSPMSEGGEQNQKD